MAKKKAAKKEVKAWRAMSPKEEKLGLYLCCKQKACTCDGPKY